MSIKRKEEIQLGWKSIRDMAKNGIGHSGLKKYIDTIKEKQKSKNK